MAFDRQNAFSGLRPVDETDTTCGDVRPDDCIADDAGPRPVADDVAWTCARKAGA